MRSALIFIVVFILSVGAGYVAARMFIGTDETEVAPVKDAEVEDTDYNVEKDVWVNDLLNTTPLFTERWSTDVMERYTIRFDECELGVVHYLAIPYKQGEYWNYSCTMKDGVSVMIQSWLDVIEHKLNPTTYERLRAYCQTIK